MPDRPALRRRRRILPWLAIACAAIGGCAWADDRAGIDDALRRVRETNGVPALAAMLQVDGRVVYAGASGVRKAGDDTPVTRDDAFHLGSDTKAMTATLVALFIDEGRLSWTSTLGDLLPGIGAMHPAYRSVTVAMLLAHRSGLGSEAAFDRGRLFLSLREPGLDPVEGRARVARAMLSSAPETEPGSRFAYSNAGYIVVGHLLEQLSGKPWETLMRERLFAPLAMASCGFGPLGDPAVAMPGQPWAHRPKDAGWEPVVLDNPETLGPAGTVHCAMADWMKFVTLHVEAFDGAPRLASADAFRHLHDPYPGQDYTTGGWFRTERGWADGVVFTHDGSNTLNYATVWWAPRKKLAVIAVTNAGGVAGQRAAQQAVNVVIAADGAR